MIDKERILAEYISRFSLPAIAYSGGRDSGFLVWFVRNKMRKDAVVLCVDHCLIPPGEREYRLEMARLYGWHDVVELYVEILDLPEVRINMPHRCYACKKHLMGILMELAKEKGCDALFDGTTLDERSKYRPGLKALEELGVISPLADTGWTKEDVQSSSKNYGLAFAAKPPQSCLATRFPYNQRLTRSLIKKIGQIEGIVKTMVNGPFRVRSHQEIGLIRIEVDPDGAGNLFIPEVRKKLVHAVRESGFRWVTVDMEGFRSGSWDLVNETSRKEG